LISSPSLIHKLQQTIDIVRRRLADCCSGSRLGRDLHRVIKQLQDDRLRCDIPLESSLTHPGSRSFYCPYIKGPPGPPGSPGTKGAKGDRGSVGPKGSKGSRGPTGDRGGKGSQGPVGPKGNQGSIYIQTCLPRGFPGSMGEKGQKGDQGFTGAKGVRGLHGDACAPSVGPQGDTGDAGAPGLDRSKGQKGTQGQNGQKGEMALGDITEGAYESYLNMIQEITKKIESGGCCSSVSCHRMPNVQNLGPG